MLPEDIEMENEELVDPIDAIENMTLSFLEQLSACSRSQQPDDDSSDEAELGMHRSKTIKLRLVDRTRPDAFRNMTFPKKTSTGSAKPFAQLFRVLDSMHECILQDIPATKRDIYYKDVPLFKAQRTVDCLVDDLAATFDVERSQLNIRATSKGLICGSALDLILVNGARLHGGDMEATLIPVGEDIRSFDVKENILWVLIVEKDAIFQHLCRRGITNHPSLPGRGLLITGKGYPDMATRHLVKTLSDNLPSNVPILALVDGDAFGIDILSVYKYGSKALQHENGKLAAKRVKWLGLFSSELAQLNIDRDALIPISKHDEKKALSMLRRGTDLPAKWRKELMYMLHSRRKAEIEILYTAGETVGDSSFETQSSLPPMSGDPAVHGSPLLHYLIKKITASVAGS